MTGCVGTRDLLSAEGVAFSRCCYAGCAIAFCRGRGCWAAHEYRRQWLLRVLPRSCGEVAVFVCLAQVLAHE